MSRLKAKGWQEKIGCNLLGKNWGPNFGGKSRPEYLRVPRNGVLLPVSLNSLVSKAFPEKTQL